jgi:diguanylate cyclase (GGDEF)-like protein
MYLAAIVVAVVVLFGLVGVASALGRLDAARDRALVGAEQQAELATRAISDALTSARTDLDGAAASPAFAAVLQNPSGCTLTFTDMELFPGGHLDLVDSNGSVACSSLAAEEASAHTHEDAPWLGDLADARGSFVSDPVRDPAADSTSVVVVAPIRSPAGVSGAAVVIVPLDGTAAALAETLQGPLGYDFTVTEAPGGRVLSTAGEAAPGPGPSDILVGTSSVADLGWQVSAGVDEDAALAPTYSLLRREAVLIFAALVVTLIALTVVQRRIAKPLQRLIRAVGEAGTHRVDAMAVLDGPREVVQLAEQIHETMSARDAFEHQLSHQALHDPLTALPNRALLTDRLAHALTASSTTVAVLFIDLDHFKLVNDSLGHGAGDHLLLTVATRLVESVPPGTTIARFGGDEFIVVCEDTTPDTVAQMAQSIGDLIAQPIELPDRIVTVTASIGVALARPGARAEDLVREADTAMYVAKEMGRARHHIFSERLRRQVTRRLTAENELRSALSRHELRMVYQPIVDVDSGATVGTEALMRWDHPALGSVSPLTFIPIAEETGLIMGIGEFALIEACQQTRSWHDEGLDARVSVNVSGQQISDRGFPAMVEHALAATGLSPDQLCLELTESVLMTDATRTISSLAALKALGVRLSIDDFGTGYSSLAYLQQFPVDELKIDRTFVNDLTVQPDQRALVAAMVAMASALGLEVVAEGVETTAQLSALRSLGCDLAQGYLFAAPQPPIDVSRLLRPRALNPTYRLAQPTHAK